MSTGKLVVMEGCDGAGKSTQVNFLLNYLRRNNYSYRYIHFPTMGTKWGKMVNAYLFGNLIEMGETNPYFISTLYANDRYQMKPLVDRWLRDVDIVLVDRYVYSNYALLGGQISNESQSGCMSERERYFDWLSIYEFEKNKLHIPDIVIYLNMELKFIKKNLEKRGDLDVHENFKTQKNAKQVYDDMVDNETIFSIDCVEDGILLTEDEIHVKIVNLLKCEEIIN